MKFSSPVASRIITALGLVLTGALDIAAQSGVLQFSSTAYVVKETSAAAKITVVRVGGSSGELSAGFSTSDGTASVGQDYLSTNGTLTFGPGVTSRSFYVPILNDATHETNETITIDLTGANLGMDSSATLTIQYNDPCVYSLDASGRSHGPDAGSGSIALTATEGCGWTVTESADWLSIISDASGSGSSEVQYSFDANPGGVARVATISIANRVFTVTQAGIFVPLAGSYNGLVYEDMVLRHESSGFISIKLTALGRFSAKLALGGRRFSVSGAFADDGGATNEIIRIGANPLTLVLNADLHGDSDQISGHVTDGTWTALLLADRAVFNKKTNPAEQAARYTMIVRGDEGNAANEPGGDSFGAVTVDAGGNVKMSLSLADGTKATQKVPLSKNGEWPLYVPLYRSTGSILSRVIFADAPGESDFAGTLAWIKPVLSTAKFYRAGLAEQQPLLGSIYRPPTNQTDRLLDFSTGGVAFSAGNVASAFTNAINLSDDNKVTNQATNKLTLSISRPTGLFSGSVTAPGTTRSKPFKGALFQKGNFGAGFFLGTNQSGRVLFSE